MKKIGCVTFHASHNYGSVLQAYALQTYIKKNFQDVDYKIINLRLPTQHAKYDFPKKKTSFKNKILQTINNNNLFRNKNNMLNNMKHFNPSSIKNINTQNSIADNESPVKKSKIKSLNRKNRNISSYEIGNFPLIVD